LDEEARREREFYRGREGGVDTIVYGNSRSRSMAQKAHMHAHNTSPKGKKHEEKVKVFL